MYLAAVFFTQSGNVAEKNKVCGCLSASPIKKEFKTDNCKQISKILLECCEDWWKKVNMNRKARPLYILNI